MPVIGGDSPTSGVGCTDSEEPCSVGGGGGVGIGSGGVIGGGIGGGVALCAGCGAKIADRYYLLAVDRQWHSHCLKCCECKLRLDSELTCFAREGNIYCKEDYYRLFAVKRCARCHLGISANELVMRARDLVYHLHCFNCASCNKALTKGEQFGMRDSMVYCRTHYETLMLHHVGGGGGGGGGGGVNVMGGAATAAEYAATAMTELHDSGAYRTGSGRIPSFFNGVGTVQKGRPRKRKQTTVHIEHSDAVGHHHHSLGSIGPSTLELMPNGSELCGLDGGGGGGGNGGYDTTSPPTNASSVSSQHAPRTKRMRTSFKHHQLRTMKSYFALNQNPDAKDLKQLAQKTGLSKRVLQVWFQNARAKWRRNMMRQENQSSDKGSGGDSCPGGITDLNSSGSHLGGDHPMTPTPLGDIPSGALTSESQSPPSLHFGDLY